MCPCFLSSTIASGVVPITTDAGEEALCTIRSIHAGSLTDTQVESLTKSADTGAQYETSKICSICDETLRNYGIFREQHHDEVLLTCFRSVMHTLSLFAAMHVSRS